MIEPPRGILQTPIGTVNFTMTEAAHVFLHTESRNHEAIIIRGIPYHVSYHCHLVDGQWTAKDYNNPYLSRKDCFNKEASQPAIWPAKCWRRLGPSTLPRIRNSASKPNRPRPPMR